MIGEIAALSTALCWAVAARMFRILGTHISPLLLVLYKGVIAVIGLLLIVLVWPTEYQLTDYQYALLLLSGAIGIGVGDSCFFKAINKISDSQAILVAETLAPIFTALMAIAWLQEWLSWQQWTGVALVIFAVDMCIKVQHRESEGLMDRTGFFYAAAAALCQAIGAVLSRDVLTTSAIDPANASLIRLYGGIAIVLPLLLIRKERLLQPKLISIAPMLVAATFIGTLLALYLQMLSFSFTKAAIVQTLFVTSVLFSFAIASFFGERASKRTTFWAVLAMLGVVVLLVAD